MSAKVTKVALECLPWGTTQSFEIAHAERILRMQNNGGWKLPGDSPFEFVDNGIRRKPNKAGDNRTTEAGSDKPSYIAPKPD